MRIWSIHPRYLDAKGLVALWRETLLAKHVLDGRTTGYTRHPQLKRFRSAAEPLAAVNVYLAAVYAEAVARGYLFDPEKFSPAARHAPLPVTQGQVVFEAEHLLAKLQTRDPARHKVLATSAALDVHPLFVVVPGGVEAWEVILKHG